MEILRNFNIYGNQCAWLTSAHMDYEIDVSWLFDSKCKKRRFGDGIAGPIWMTSTSLPASPHYSWVDLTP